MTYINNLCVDAGTNNCPCPLAETGDCLICSRLVGRDKCDCSWAGLCIYNEFIQNDGKVRNKRRDMEVKIVSRTWYSTDLLVIVLQVPRSLALSATVPGSFVFVNGMSDNPFYNVPVSVMTSDVQKAQIRLAVKVISAKTKAIADAKGNLWLRGVYRSGLIGIGREPFDKRDSYLIFTKGVGFAPALNFLKWMEGKGNIRIVVDAEKLTDEFVWAQLRTLGAGVNEKLSVTLAPLSDYIESSINIDEYQKIFVLASDYYIGEIKDALNIPSEKLICSNNFHMCCGEGICGACSCVDEEGNITKMCKCRQKE